MFSNISIKDNYVMHSIVGRKHTIVTDEEIEAFIKLHSDVSVYNSKENIIKLYNFDEITKSRIQKNYNRVVEHEEKEKFTIPHIDLVFID